MGPQQLDYPRTPGQTAKLEEIATAARSFIKAHYLEKGYSPSAKEISKACGIKSISTMWYWLETLKRCGLVDFDRRRPRTFRIPGQQAVFPGHPLKEELEAPGSGFNNS